MNYLHNDISFKPQSQEYHNTKIKNEYQKLYFIYYLLKIKNFN
jgi:hypothetical protein